MRSFRHVPLLDEVVQCVFKSELATWRATHVVDIVAVCILNMFVFATNHDGQTIGLNRPAKSLELLSV